MPLSREGKERSFRENLTLATTLPGVAGMVNAIGYVQLGFYSSHMTGRASGIGINAAKGKMLDAGFALGLLFMFLLGAMTASLLIELAKIKHKPRFALPLFIEALLLSTILVAELSLPRPVTELLPEQKIFFACALAMSMGLQNALVARLSGAVVRTTHLTGLTTDLGIELVRVIRWYIDISRDKSLTEHVRHLAEVRKDAQLYRVRLYIAIASTFIIGAFIGATLSGAVGVYALLLPILIVVGLVVYDRILAVSEEDLEADYNPKIDVSAAEAAARHDAAATPPGPTTAAAPAPPTPPAAGPPQSTA